MNDQATAPDDPTAANELAELQLLANEETAHQQQRADAAADEQAEHDTERAQYYCKKIFPFVRAFGDRLKRPLVDREAVELTKALADVGVRLIPSHAVGLANPWANLLIVSLTIAAPRVVAEWNDQRAAKARPVHTAENDAAGNDATRAPPTGDDMLDAARAFDADNESKPH